MHTPKDKCNFFSLSEKPPFTDLHRMQKLTDHGESSPNGYIHSTLSSFMAQEIALKEMISQMKDRRNHFK